MLTLSNIHKTYEGKPLLKGISLEVSAGETICLLGPSGSGKSTLLRIISGLEDAESGEIHWKGKDFSSMPSHLRNFGLIFQDYALFPHLNVFENVAFGLKMASIRPSKGIRGYSATKRRLSRMARFLPSVSKSSNEEIRQRVEESLKQVDLLGFESRRVTDLSGGEQQRVALARALAPRPRLLLFDEPLGALDRKLREYLLAELREILQESRVPAVYVTHDQEEAFALADRVLLLHEGEIVQRGAPAEVYAHPVDGWVAEFLGAGNVLKGKMLGNGFVETMLGTVKMPLTRKQVEGMFVTLLIHPQDVTLGNSSSPLSGRVDDIRFQQNRYRVTLEGGFYFYLPDPPEAGEEIRLEIQNIRILEK